MLRIHAGIVGFSNHFHIFGPHTVLAKGHTRCNDLHIEISVISDRQEDAVFIGATNQSADRTEQPLLRGIQLLLGNVIKRIEGA